MKLFITMLLVSKVLYLLAILFVLRKFFFSLKKDQLFNLKNAGILKLLALLVLLGPPLKYLSGVIVNNWIAKHFVMDMLNGPSGSVAYEVGHTLGYTLAGGNNFFLGWILTGLLILVIAEVSKQGLKMKEEQDLTI